MAATLERSQNWLSMPRVSASRTQADNETGLRPDLRVIAGHLDAIREQLANAAARDTAWQEDVSRLLGAFAAETATRIFTPTAPAGLNQFLPTMNPTGNLVPLSGTRIEFGGTTPDLRPNSLSVFSPLVGTAIATAGPGVQVFHGGLGEEYNNVNRFSGVVLNTVGGPLNPFAPLTFGEERRPAVGFRRTHEGLRAFEEVKRWLDLSDEQTAEVTGLGRTTKYSWERDQIVPRPSTIRVLLSLREALSGFVRAKGEPELRRWLHRAGPTGSTPINRLLAGQVDQFLGILSQEIFATSPARPRSDFHTLTPDPDVLEPSDAPRQLRRRARRPRGPRDQ